MPRKRKSKTSKETIASTLLISEDSRFLRDFQCLEAEQDVRWEGAGEIEAP